jgi:hypothetical protein
VNESGRFFEKKLRKKLLFPPAFERPQDGRSKAEVKSKVVWLPRAGRLFSEK